MGEWQVEELQNLEERTEPVDEPMLIVFGDASLQNHSEQLTPRLK